jgi:hypothetical protein
MPNLRPAGARRVPARVRKGVLMSRIVIGMDPHKRSATIEVLDEAEQPVLAGRFGTDSECYWTCRRSCRRGRGCSRPGRPDAQFARMLPILLDTVDQRTHLALVLLADGRPIGVGRLRSDCAHGACEVVVRVGRSSAVARADAA